MGTVSSTWPWLIDLNNQETNQFFKDLQDATMADSNYEIAEKIDRIVVDAKRVAEERREAENERFRRSLLEEARTAQDRAKRAEESAERADMRAEKAREEKQALEDQLASLRSFLSRRNEQCLTVDPDEVAKYIGWGQ